MAAKTILGWQQTHIGPICMLANVAGWSVKSDFNAFQGLPYGLSSRNAVVFKKKYNIQANLGKSHILWN